MKKIRRVKKNPRNTGKIIILIGLVLGIGYLYWRNLGK